MKNEKNGKLISECERNSVILQPTWEKVEGSIFCPSFGELENTLREMARPGDIILTVGAGDVYKVGESLVK